APLIAVPKIAPQDETISLGDEFRARRPIGQRSIIFERRVNDGLLGTGVGAKWEELPPIDAAFGAGLPGLRPVFVDVDQLRRAIPPGGAVVFAPVGGFIDGRTVAKGRPPPSPRRGGNKLPPPPPISRPSKIEMRIGVSLNGSAQIEKREATRD